MTLAAEARRNSTASGIWVLSGHTPTESFRCCARTRSTPLRATTTTHWHGAGTIANAATPTRGTITLPDLATATPSRRHRRRTRNGWENCRGRFASRWGVRESQRNSFIWESTTPDHFLEKLLHDHDSEAIFATHTGIKWSRRLPGDKLFANVGVLGRPENDGTQRVWYSFVETNGSTLEVTSVPVNYDPAALMQEMRAEDLPDEFVETIETGWWSTCLEILPAKERLRGKW